MIAILDYGMGNVKSIYNAIEKIGLSPKITKDKEEIKSADWLVIPGVGSFAQAMKNIRDLDLEEMIKSKNKILGICLGFQIMLKKGYEGGETQGLGIFPGEVKKIDSKTRMGWEYSETLKDYFYYCHSYGCYISEDNWSEMIHAKNWQGEDRVNYCGLQFHPEKSGKAGLKLLKEILC